MLRRLVACAALAAALLSPALAHDRMAGDLHIIHPWIAEPPPGAAVAAGYVAISNEGAHDDRLVAVEMPVAARPELHTMAMTDEGVAQMRPVEGGIAIPAGETVLLQQGGFHIMLMELAERPLEGETIPGVLVFERAGRVAVDFVVERLAHGASMHGDEGSENHMNDGAMEMETQ